MQSDVYIFHSVGDTRGYPQDRLVLKSLVVWRVTLTKGLPFVNVRHRLADTAHENLIVKGVCPPQNETAPTTRGKARQLPSLLSDPKCMKHTLQFLHDSAQFTQTFGDLTPPRDC
ncbi:hypothetical protein L210DRAFT_3542524 [Boletus edulis BED1]|uniref:Uncharacterized protein n=1 Tax=Boletus edulis BED1 TaxID=1328754 RepID=A0AAD4BTD1_BOLED|nr:hypothetical protein L210DRAFT_3542524 [Boletus edulis BED1]